MFSLARKNHLARNLTRLQKTFPNDYNFFPKTWLLPAEFSDFIRQFNVPSKVNPKQKKNPVFIAKPEASCQGRGIFLSRSLDDFDPQEHYVVQKYLTKPFLIDDLKFDLRIYVLVSGISPMRIWIYKEGLCRMATEPYVTPNGANLDNLFMHLTNYAINKKSDKFEYNEDCERDDVGHKRSYTYVLKYLQEQGVDTAKLEHSIERVIIKTLCSVQPSIAHVYKSCQPDDLGNQMCFEVLGFDVILDHKLRPLILEVNHTPSFTADTPLDTRSRRA